MTRKAHEPATSLRPRMRVDGMSCPSREHHVDKALREAGAREVEADFRRGEVLLVVDAPPDTAALSAGLVLACLSLAACSGTGTRNPSAPTQPALSGTINVGQPLGTSPLVPSGWRRPLDVSPAPEQGKFKIIAQEPAPGDKVRVFFLGAQF